LDFRRHSRQPNPQSYATDTDDATEMPRWGKIGKQRIVDEGPLPPFPDMSNVPNMHDLPFLKAKYDMTTFDEVLVKASSDFMDKAKRENKPFFVWHNTHAHARVDVPREEVQRDAKCRDQLRCRRSRDGAAG